MDKWTNGPMDQWTNAPIHGPTNGLMDQNEFSGRIPAAGTRRSSATAANAVRLSHAWLCTTDAVATSHSTAYHFSPSASGSDPPPPPPPPPWASYMAAPNAALRATLSSASCTPSCPRRAETSTKLIWSISPFVGPSMHWCIRPFVHFSYSRLTSGFTEVHVRRRRWWW